MESNHIRQPIKIVTVPIFQCFLNRCHAPKHIKKMINIPGGNRKGVNIFFNKNICQHHSICRQVDFFAEHYSGLDSQRSLPINQVPICLSNTMTKNRSVWRARRRVENGTNIYSPVPKGIVSINRRRV